MDKPEPVTKPNEEVAEAIFQHVFGGRGDSVDIRKVARLISGWESTQYYLRHMQAATLFNAPKPLYSHALGLRSIEGMTMEFGVSGGRTITQIAGETPGKVYGFDGFQGLPENWKFGRGKGAFAREAPPPVPENVELVIGWFADTLPGFVAAHPEPVSFLHVDCDLYSSTKDILDHLGPHIAPGTVVAFNEYYNYPGWQDHEIKAWKEFVAATGTRYRYAAVNAQHQQVAVVVEEAPAFAFRDKLRPRAAV
jgi:hypothetical protein